MAANTLPWIEKYRPRVLEDVVGNSGTLQRLRVIAMDGNMPNLLLAGAPGIGKTTSVLCLARELLAPPKGTPVRGCGAGGRGRAGGVE